MPKLKMPAFISKHPRRTLWISLVVVVLVGAGGYAYYQRVYLPKQTTDVPTMQTATARQGDLIIYASGTGTLVPAAVIFWL